MNYEDYGAFWLGRVSLKAIEDGKNIFTREEVEWALSMTDYKYFGVYEFDDKQKMAVDILAWAVQQYLREGVV